ARCQGAGVVRRFRKNLRLATHPCRPARRGVAGRREHRRRLDAPARAAGTETEAAQGIDQAGQAGGEVPGPAETRLHRLDAESQELYRYHRESKLDEGKLYLASVLDPCGRRLLAAPMSDHPDAELAGDAIKMAAAARGGRAVIDEVIFHTDRGSTYTAGDFTKLCRKLGIRQSMGRVGSCFDN